MKKFKHLRESTVMACCDNTIDTNIINNLVKFAQQISGSFQPSMTILINKMEDELNKFGLTLGDVDTDTPFEDEGTDDYVVQFYSTKETVKNIFMTLSWRKVSGQQFELSADGAKLVNDVHLIINLVDPTDMDDLLASEDGDEMTFVHLDEDTQWDVDYAKKIADSGNVDRLSHHLYDVPHESLKAIHKELSSNDKHKKMFDKATKGSNFNLQESFYSGETSDGAAEILNHNDNQEHLHKRHQMISKSMSTKFKKGQYDSDKAKISWTRHAKDVAKDYTSQYGSKSSGIFSHKDISDAASKWEDYSHSEMKSGNLHEESLDEARGKYEQDWDKSKSSITKPADAGSTKDKVVKGMKKTFKAFRDRVGKDSVNESSKEDLLKRAKDQYDMKMKNASDPASRAEAKDDYDHMVKSLSVNEESLDEVSKETLGAYVKKAKNSMTASYRVGDGDDWHNDKVGAAKAYAKGKKRAQGIDKAIDKLTEEQIDEVSKETLTSYISKASDAKSHKSMSTDRVDKRYTGVKKASDKLAEESLDEVSKGMLKRYTDKAVKDLAVTSQLQGSEYERRNSAENERGYNAADKNAADYAKIRAKRQTGIMKAVNKLTEASDETDTIKMNVPAFIRCMEYAMEDIKEDAELHEFVEHLLAMSKAQDVLDTDAYEKAVEACSKEEKAEIKD